MADESKQEQRGQQVPNPFGQKPAERGAGALVQADRAQQEIQAAMVIAHSRPRDPMRAMDRILQDCSRPTVAETGLYAYPKGGETVSGPSIRLAELVEQRWGNLWCGVTELQQDRDKTVAMAWAWDLETNARDERTFTVPHMRHTRRGSYRVEDPREIYEMVANYGARRKRAAIQTVVPREVFDAAVEQIERTLAENVSVDAEAISKMVAAFGEYGVTQDQLVRYIGHRLDSMVSAEMVRLKKVYASIRDGFAAARDFFVEPEPTGGGGGDAGEGQTSSGAERFKQAAPKKKAASKKKAAARQKSDTPAGAATEAQDSEGSGENGESSRESGDAGEAPAQGGDFSLDGTPDPGGMTDDDVERDCLQNLDALAEAGDVDTIRERVDLARDILSPERKDQVMDKLNTALERAQGD